jgi:all-trans-8'-apo-beta-carotenal 15,15'-oxygenase
MTTTTTAAAMPARTRSWNAAMAASPGALDITVPASAIEGVMPEALRGGQLLSNGPGWTRIGDRTAHPFDGHGYVRAFSFADDGSCTVRARYVQTATYKLEAQAGRMVRRGFATNLASRWSNIGFGPPRNVANTTIQRFGERLLAGWEGGLPHALDPDSLETIGEDDLDGAIAGQTTLAHFKRDAQLDRLVSCSLRNGRTTTLTFREFDAQRRLMRTREGGIAGMLFAHDFALTPSWYVVGGNPLRLRPAELARMLLGSGTLLRSVEPDLTQPGVLHLIAREGAAVVRTVKLPGPAFVVHFGNAFEQDGAVVVDAAVFSRFTFGEEFGYTGPSTPFDPALPEARGAQRLLRITVPASSDTATWEPLTTHGVDFPRFHPDHEGRPTPMLFGATRRDPRFSDPFDSVIGVDLIDRQRPAALWTAPDNVFVGEPVVVPNPERDDGGFVVSILSDGLQQQTRLAVFAARDIAAGPVAVVPFPLLPIAFHGDWVART